MMKILVATVIYQSGLIYLNDCLESLIQQEYSDFDILIVNDDVDEKLLFDYCGERLSLLKQRIHLVHTGGLLQIFELRIKMLEYAKDNGYEFMIMVDCDDKCGVERVRNCVEQVDSQYTFFYNEIVDFRGKQIMPDLPRDVKCIDEILECNFLGLTNTAILIPKLSNDVIAQLYNGKTAIFDWFLFSVIILNKGYGKKIEKAKSFYREIENNVSAGLISDGNEYVEKEILVKKEHYLLLEKYDSIFRELYEKYNRQSYIKNEEERRFWWGMLK